MLSKEVGIALDNAGYPIVERDGEEKPNVFP